jgi:hypothetical protein
MLPVSGRPKTPRVGTSGSEFAPGLRETPVFTRVRKNLPPLTMRLSKAFVNGKTSVSTGFLRFSPVFAGKPRKMPHFRRRERPPHA